MGKTITIFGSSTVSEGTPEYTQAYETGRALSRAGFSICNGGYNGTMAAAAKGAAEAGGATIGVTTEFFQRSPNPWIQKVVTTKTPVERLLKLIELGDGYIILRGGTGTMLELAAVWEFVNKGVIAEKLIVLLGGFWNPVVETLKEELIREGILDSGRFIRQVATPDACVREFSRRFGAG